MDIRQGILTGGDYIVIIDNKLDQIGYSDRRHTRTKAITKLNQWEDTGFLKDIFRKKEEKNIKVTYVPDTQTNRKIIRKGRRLDKFIISEDLCTFDTKVTHTNDADYTRLFNMENHFDHGSVRLEFTTTKLEIGLGSFNLDPYLIKTGALDSICKQVIYEATFFNTQIPEIIKAYETRNKNAHPMLRTLAGIQHKREKTKQYNILEETKILEYLDHENYKLPTMDQLHAINKEVANDVLTEIQNGVITKVRAEQLALKKSVKNELKTITDEIDELNKKLEEAPDDETRNKLEEV
jgi:hypothetical protein